VDLLLSDFFAQLLQLTLHVGSIVLLACIATPYFLLITVPLALMFYFIQRYFRNSSREMKRLDAV
jgi:ATP-binding cassette subfamily C (CFTR/MRP) protein 4